MAQKYSSRRNGWKKYGIIKLKVVAEKLLNKSKKREFEHEDSTNSVPKDVKEGHFAVMANDDGKPKRFVIALSYLTHPEFKKLLEQSAEEFGFEHNGAVKVPCRSIELERILVNRILVDQSEDEEEEEEEEEERENGNNNVKFRGKEIFTYA